jgi:multiple sugar transport system substrate-binding protein
MNKKFAITFVSLLALAALVLGACAPAASPTPVTIKETVPVQQTVVVQQTSVVEKLITPTPAPVEPVTITYYEFSSSPDHVKDMAQLVQDFEADHPNIKIDVQTAPFADYFTKLQTLIAGGQAPDVFEMNADNFVNYASKGLLLDVNPLAKADPNFNAKNYYEGANKAFTYNGMQLAMPTSFSTVVLFYNKDLFDKAGVAYPTNDWTWDDVMAAAKKLNDPAHKVWGMNSNIQFWEFFKKIAQNGCSIFNADYTQVTINDPACVQALETEISFLKAGVMPSDAQKGGVPDEQMFKAGQLAMDTNGIWQFAAFKDAPFNWDIVVEPGMKQKATHFFANSAAVFAATKHPQEAWEWVKFFTSDPRMAKIRIDTGWELPAINNADYVKDYLVQTPPANRQAVFDSLNYSVLVPVIARESELQDTITNMLNKVVLGQLTPQQGLDQVKPLIEKLLQ